MADVTLDVAPYFPAGTTLYAFRFISDNPDGVPAPVTQDASSTVSNNGQVAFTGLTGGASYWIGTNQNPYNFIGATTPASTPTSGGSGVDQTARDAAAAAVTSSAQKAANLSDLADAGSARANIHSQVLASVRVVATTNITRSGTQTIDGAALAVGDRVLLSAQTTATQNGPWVVAAGAWARPSDYATGQAALRSRQVTVNEGTYAGQSWQTLSSVSRVVDTDATAWAAMGAVVSQDGGTALTTRARLDLRGPVVATDDSAGNATRIQVLSESLVVTEPRWGGAGLAVDGSADWRAAFMAAIAALGTKGGEVVVPPGNYGMSSFLVVPGGVTVRGTALDYSIVGAPPARGSILTALAGFTGGAVVQLGDDATSTASGKTGPAIEKLIVDGAGIANYAIRTIGRRARIDRCQGWRGTDNAVRMDGQNGHLQDSVLGQNRVGSVVRIGNIDNKMYGCQVREGGTAHVELVGGPVEVGDNHIFGGGYSSNIPCILITPTGSLIDRFQIIRNTIESTFGHEIRYVGPAGAEIQGLQVIGNIFYQIDVGFPSNTYDVVNLDMSAAGTILRQLIVSGNVGQATQQYRTLVRRDGAGVVEQSSVTDNHWNRLAAFFTTFTPDSARGNTLRRFNSGTSAYIIEKTDNRGRSSQNGTGAQTAFTIPHGIGGTPTNLSVTAGSTDARGDFSATADGTNITVTYAAAPATGTGNVTLNWQASL